MNEILFDEFDKKIAILAGEIRYVTEVLDKLAKIDNELNAGFNYIGDTSYIRSQNEIIKGILYKFTLTEFDFDLPENKEMVTERFRTLFKTYHSQENILSVFQLQIARYYLAYSIVMEYLTRREERQRIKQAVGKACSATSEMLLINSQDNEKTMDFLLEAAADGPPPEFLKTW